MAARSSNIRFLYKVLSSYPPMPIPRTFTPVDAADGFIHLSIASQTPATASRFFDSESKVWLVKIDLEKLEAGPGEVKWEQSRSHGVFAHLYGADVEESTVADVSEKARKEGSGWEDVLGGLEQ